MEDQATQEQSYFEKNPVAAQTLGYFLLFVVIVAGVWAGITLAHKSL